MESVRPSQVPLEWTQKLSPARKLALASEILRAYCRVRWEVRRGRHLPSALAALRSVCDATEGPDSWRHEYLQAARIGWAVRRTLRWVPTDSRCLMQSLVLTALLAKRGIATSLVIGVEPGREAFRAHAWVEYRSEPLLPGSQGLYQPLTQL